MSEIVADAALSAPAAEEPVAAPEAAEPAWSGPSQEEWTQVVNGLGYLATQFAPQEEQQPQQQPQSLQVDPFAEDFTSQLQQVIRQELAPLADYQQHEQLAEAEERAYDILDDLSSRSGEIVNKEQAFPIIRAWADTMMPEMAQRYGFGPQAAEKALEQAYNAWQELEKGIGSTYTERHMNQLTNLGGARAEPAEFTGAAQTTEIPQGGDELDIVRRWGGFPGPT